MVDLLTKKYAVFGNPIKHSLSPEIHRLFSIETKVNKAYVSFYVPINDLENTLLRFFNCSGKGANITLPFKNRAFLFSNVLTDQAKVSGSVNTLKKLKNNLILGDNTDGIGLLHDLKRLHFIKDGSKVLLIGAGGAAYAVVPSLLSFGCDLFIFNRTVINAKLLISKFKKIGNIHYAESSFLKKNFFNVIINATSSGIYNTIPNISSKIVSPETFFYDMYYQSEITPFLKWCKKNGAIYMSDGLGMLVSQAAHSFYLWHNKFPNIDRTVNVLRKMLKTNYLSK